VEKEGIVTAAVTPRDPKRVLDDDTIYEGDNGRLLCVACSGMTAAYTGRDLSGQPVRAVTPEYAIEFERALADIGAKCACESCGKVAPKVYLA
jgi:hypothetical protein